MIRPTTSPQEKRLTLKSRLKDGTILKLAGAYSPLVAMLLTDIGFDGVYISGATLANDLGFPDIGLTTLTEVTERSRAISRVTKLPSIVDIDTGFGESINVARSIREMEDAGLSGCHIEDQQMPKRCGHLDHKVLIEPKQMIHKLQSALKARRDANFLIIARCDARSVEGLDAALDRAKAYADSGADMIFPEALKDEGEFERFRKEIKVPLLANMTEFGKSKLLTANELQSLGYDMVIYPVTAMRLALKAVKSGMSAILAEGGQANHLDSMLTREELYELLGYRDYSQFDKDIYNFDL